MHPAGVEPATLGSEGSDELHAEGLPKNYTQHRWTIPSCRRSGFSSTVGTRTKTAPRRKSLLTCFCQSLFAGCASAAREEPLGLDDRNHGRAGQRVVRLVRLRDCAG